MKKNLKNLSEEEHAINRTSWVINYSNIKAYWKLQLINNSIHSQKYPLIELYVWLVVLV